MRWKLHQSLSIASRLDDEWVYVQLVFGTIVRGYQSYCLRRYKCTSVFMKDISNLIQAEYANFR